MTSEPSSKTPPVVAIDGPAGAGKSTVALLVAQALGFQLVDTGALYRGVALVALEQGLDLQDGVALGQLADSLALAFTTADDGTPRLMIDGRDRADEIRSPEVARGASDVSRHPEVRAALLGLQRRLGESGGVVLEGRDIGTVVFPDAEAKVFLSATPEERARRRVQDFQERGRDTDFGEILRQIKERDHQDESRDVAPLKPADEAYVLDSTTLPLEQVVAKIVAFVNRRRA